MRARKLGKVSMDAEFYAEDKTLNKPYAKINFNIYFDLIDRNKHHYTCT